MSTPHFTVVTDSTADIPEHIAIENDIEVVPLTVSFGTDTYADGELTQAEFFERMARERALPTTSQPPVGAFIAAYEKALERAEQVVSVHVSNKLSGTVEAARQAAERFDGRVHVFDSLNLSWGLAWQVVEAARFAKAGVDVPTALERLEEVRRRVKLIVGLDSLDNLAKGGRIGQVSAFLGSMLNLKVTFTVDETGAFCPLARNRGAKAALAHTLDWVAEQMGQQRRGSFAIGHAMELERAEWIAEQLRAEYDVEDIVIYEAGPVICTHTGTGWGVAVLPAR